MHVPLSCAYVYVTNPVVDRCTVDDLSSPSDDGDDVVDVGRSGGGDDAASVVLQDSRIDTGGN